MYRILYLIVISLCGSLHAQQCVHDPELLSLPGVKTIHEWRQWADTEEHDNSRWLKSRRRYYPNGQLQEIFYVGAEGDTIELREYILSADSLVVRDRWYNAILDTVMEGDTYYYREGGRQPYKRQDTDGWSCSYRYDSKGRVIGRVHEDDARRRFAEYEYTFDSTGLLAQTVEFDFFGDERNVSRIAAYSYEHTSSGSRRDERFIPTTTKESITRTNDQGEAQVTYFGFNPKTSTLIETVWFNAAGERIKKIEYDREGKPQFVWTYEYDYYK